MTSAGRPLLAQAAPAVSEARARAKAPGSKGWPFVALAANALPNPAATDAGAAEVRRPTREIHVEVAKAREQEVVRSDASAVAGTELAAALASGGLPASLALKGAGAGAAFLLVGLVVLRRRPVAAQGPYVQLLGEP